MSVVVFPEHTVSVTQGEPTVWDTKARCSNCGTHLFSEIPEMKIRAVKANLLSRTAFVPAFHQHCLDAILPVKDDLPHYKGFPPQFGGSDAVVDW